MRLRQTRNWHRCDYNDMQLAEHIALIICSHCAQVVSSAGKAALSGMTILVNINMSWLLTHQDKAVVKLYEVTT